MKEEFSFIDELRGSACIQGGLAHMFAFAPLWTKSDPTNEYAG